MSNAQKPKGKPNSLARYRAEAKKEPFTLWLDDDSNLEIQAPSADQVFAAEEAVQGGGATSKDIISLIAGGQAEALLKAIGPEDADVMKAILKDIQEHFGLGEN